MEDSGVEWRLCYRKVRDEKSKGEEEEAEHTLENSQL